MIFAYIGSLIVILLLIGLSALAVVWITHSVNRSIRTKTLDLISEYDEILAKKSEKLAVQAVQTVQSVENEPAEPAPAQQTTVSAPALADGVLDALSTPNYIDRGISDAYRTIRNGFTFSVEDALKAVPTPTEGLDAVAQQLLGQLTFDTVFAMSSLPAGQQYQLLADSLEGDEKTLLERFPVGKNGFQITQFCDFLRQTAADCDTVGVLRVAPGSKISVPGQGLRIVEDEGLCEGFQLESGKRVYDYSIKVREIS